MTVGFGPLINQAQAKTVMGFIEISKKEGAKLLAGGERLRGGDFDRGFYLAPTVFEINEGHTIFKEEIFGPVVGITKFKTEEEGIRLANNSIYGLAGAIWSKNQEKALSLAQKIQSGTVWVNEYHLLNPGMPFGGFKQSGIGREMGTEGILSYLEVKHLWISECNSREKKPWFDHLF
jgi:aldehyde dehydrogenase (NAD+)